MTDPAPAPRRRTASISHAAKRLGMTPAALRSAMTRDGVHVMFFVGRWRCYADDLERWVAGRDRR